MTTDEMSQGPTVSARATAEDLASGIEAQRLRVDALGVADETGSPDVDTVLAEIDVAHEELRVAEEALRAQQQRLDALLEERSAPRSWQRGLLGSLPVAAVVTDRDGVVLELNPAAWSLVGLRRDEILRRPLRTLLDPSCHAELAAALRTVTSPPGAEPAAEDERPAAGAVGPVSVRLALAGADAGPRPVDMVVGVDDAASPDALVTWVAADGLGGHDPLGGMRTAEAFAEMCRLPLQAGTDTRDVLARAALLVEKAIPASDGVSITLGPPGAPEAQATDNALAQAVDGAQLQAGEGPCLSAYTSGEVVVCQDLRTDPRWTRLAPLAVPVGVAAVLGCPIRTDSHTLGVLNVYSREPDVFDARDRDVADLLVSAVLAVVQETRDRRELTELSQQLRDALESRAVIDQAKGIIMGRAGYDADAAFAQLVAASRRSNTKVRDVAQLVVDEVSVRRTDEADGTDGSDVADGPAGAQRRDGASGAPSRR